jgi:hypothetical protein
LANSETAVEFNGLLLSPQLMAITHRVDTSISPSASFPRGLIVDVCPRGGVSDCAENDWLDDLFSFGFPDHLALLIQCAIRNRFANIRLENFKKQFLTR